MQANFPGGTRPEVAPPHPPTIPELANRKSGAVFWHDFGFTLLPRDSQADRFPFRLAVWQEGLSSEKIKSHWSENPGHDVGFVPGDGLVVFNAQSPESHAALIEIEKLRGISPNLVTESANKVSHVYRLAKSAFVISDWSVKERKPDQIAVVTGAVLVNLPPTSGSKISLIQAAHVADLVEVDQPFIDAVFAHNGKPAPRPANSPLPNPIPEQVAAAVTPSSTSPVAANAAPTNPLDKYSLRDHWAELEAGAIEAIAIFGDLLYMGQFSVLYAPPNTGKTLMILYSLIEDIRLGKIDPTKVYYLNMDDNQSGVVEKLKIAVEFGFHILVDGYEEFCVKQFVAVLLLMIENDMCRGVILVLDTYKKFCSVMDKALSSKFNKLLRRFSMKGGTVIALAHTNKRLGIDGKPIYGGTTDIVDDCDCAYIGRVVATVEGAKDRTVEFENIKRRGSGPQSIAYNYSVEPGLSYSALLASVRVVDAKTLEPLKQAEAIRSDAEVIVAVQACIRNGLTTKMKLAHAVANESGCSHKVAVQLLEKYTGEDPAVHRWKYSVRDHGAKVFELLASASPLQLAEKPAG